MVELVYLYDELPVLPPPSVETVGQALSKNEFFPIIEPSGIVVAKATRAYCHSGAKPLHPVVHLHIIDRYGHMYLQKRSETKDIQPGKWDTAVGGHVDFGETIMEALYREAYEELGFTEYNPIHLISYEFESSVEKEFVSVFVAIGSFELTPDLEEVEEGKWWDFEEIDENLGKDIFTPNFESEYQQIKSSLLALL